MAKRPAVVPTWITAADADPLRNVEPTADFRNYGFTSGDRPPAPWLNNLLHTAGQCFEYLFGTKTNNWERIAWGLTRLEPTLPIAAAADDDTVFTVTFQPFARLVVGGTVDAGSAGGDSRLRVSAEGEAWFTRSPTHGGGTPIGGLTTVGWTGAHWLLGTDESGTGKVWRTTNGSLVGSAVFDDSNDWAATTLPATTSGLVAFAAADTTHLAAIATNKPIYSTDDGATWTNASLSAVATGLFTDVCWTGVAWLAVTDDGEIYRATSLAGTWTKLGTDLPDKAWRLEPGPTGFVLAYPYNVGTNDDWYVSEDDGATWALQTAPTAGDFNTLARVRYLDGTWLASAGSAAPLWQATGTDAGLWTRVALDTIAGGTGPSAATIPVDLLRCDGRYVALGNSHCHRTPRAEGLDPGAFVATAAAASLRDAAYLRGRVVVDTAPTDRDVLEWDASGDAWTPTGPGAWARVHATATNYTVAADVAVVLVDSSGAARTVKLPPPAAGRAVTIKSSAGAADTNHVTVQRAGSEKIDGTAADYVIATKWGAVTLVSDATDWFVTATVA